jgi:hypothetical protein
MLALRSAVASWTVTAGTINWLGLPLARSQGVARMTLWYLPINQSLLVPRSDNYDDFQQGFSSAACDVAMSLNVSDWLLQPPFPHPRRQVFGRCLPHQQQVQSLGHHEAAALLEYHPSLYSDVPSSF